MTEVQPAGASEAIPALLVGERLDRAVALLWQCSRADATALVAAGAVELNGVVCDVRARRLAAGDSLAVAPEALAERVQPVVPQPDENVAVEVLHEDAHVVVVNKPAGLVVHPGAGHRTGTLCSGLLARYPEMATVGEPTRPGIVHRLDAGTSGLLVVARTPAAYDSLTAQLQARTVERRYEAFCWGALADDSGVIDAPVGRSERRPTLMTITERGRPARTHFEVQQRYTEPAPATHLRCRLETGRTHQIRVHLQAIGHPVIGDSTYGAGSRAGAGPDGAAKRGPVSPPVSLPGEAPGGLARPALHAARLAFQHPGDGARKTFKTPLPPDLRTLQAALA